MMNTQNGATLKKSLCFQNHAERSNLMMNTQNGATLKKSLCFQSHAERSNLMMNTQNGATLKKSLCFQNHPEINPVLKILNTMNQSLKKESHSEGMMSCFLILLEVTKVGKRRVVPVTKRKRRTVDD